MVAGHVLDRPAHYLRLRCAPDGHTNAIDRLDPSGCSAPPNGWGSAHQVSYTTERVFETLPEGLRTVRRIERRAFVILEADADPALRHAYPYDYRVFVMPGPKDVFDVFRAPRAAAEALQQVMQDTAAFASEIFGLFDAAGLDDSAGIRHEAIGLAPVRGERIERLDIGEAQIRQFLNSPLGAEIASRIQLQPDYHGLVESDVVVVNTGAGRCPEALDACVGRLEKLLGRLRHDARRHSVLYWGDIQDIGDPARHRLLQRFRSLLQP